MHTLYYVYTDRTLIYQENGRGTYETDSVHFISSEQVISRKERGQLLTD